jgi:hypothetical protein
LTVSSNIKELTDPSGQVYVLEWNLSLSPMFNLLII